MDPFTQRMLEKAEQRSRALGICSADASKLPLGDVNSYSALHATSCPSTGSGSGVGGGACATTMAVASSSSSLSQSSKQQQQQQTQKQKQKQQLPLHTHNNSGKASGSSGGNVNKLKVVERSAAMDTLAHDTPSPSPRKVLRQFSALDKENMEMGIEINIVTDKDVEVQVQVEEQEISDYDDNELSNPHVLRAPTEGTQQTMAQPVAVIRDTSRNRLQRLGALYSEKDDLSSPIHRTEGNFNAEDKDKCEMMSAQMRKPKQRLGKLAALASTINQWEDDTTHHNPHPLTEVATATTTTTTTSNVVAAGAVSRVPPPKPDLPSRRRSKTLAAIKTRAPEPPMTSNKPSNSNTKQLKWDPQVLNSLEAQGFQRRESSTLKVSYDFQKDEKENQSETVNQNINKDDKPPVGKLKTNKFMAEASNNRLEKPIQPAVASNEAKKPATVKSGLVSGRAAIFESQAQANQQQEKPQKDPTELSLKERMKLFEKNKGQALVPKAAFGMAPPISKIQAKPQAKAPASANAAAAPSNPLDQTKQPLVKSDNKLRDKVAAIFSSKNENTIREEIRKQREEEMQLLSNRFNKQKNVFSGEQQPANKTAISPPRAHRPDAPPPPPPPPAVASAPVTCKRRSPGNEIEEDSERMRPKRLYPALSDLESCESYSDNEQDCCTTATVSAINTADEMKAVAQPLRGGGYHQANRGQGDDNDDSYMESETEDSSAGICNGSLGREVMQVVKENDQQPRKVVKEVHYADKDQYFGDDTTLDSSMNSESDASLGVDNYLDEALDENEDGDDDFTQDEDADDNSRVSRDSKGTTASNSFSFRKATTPQKTSSCQPIKEGFVENHQTAAGASDSHMQPVTSELSVNKEGDNMVTLVHTVSFYRRQQNANSANSTPIRKICRETQVLRSAMQRLESHGVSGDTLPPHYHAEMDETEEESQSDTEENDEGPLVQEKTKKLLDEVCKQQQIISQTSQALNLCAATVEFSGSTESVEGERHLLVATHRRQACLDEVQRLRVEKSLRPLGAPKEKGRLTVREITVPLRQDYIRKLAADTISGHHLVCILKYNEHVLATRTVPTLPGLLAVKFPDVLQLNNVYADFKVTMEVYGMTAQREVLPHEVKYHINLNKKSGIKTPKKKGNDNRLVMPPVQSPAGPHAVRTPALVLYGYAIFSLREIQRTSWTLSQVLGVSPLEGVMHMKVNCELCISVEYKGFLTMFEDISGFGAWHRRWCHLNGTVLNYWKYPDDEKKKTPMGSIDLYTCTSHKVNTAPRDICARLNTMLLECERPARDTDQESLVLVPNGRTTTVRHLLSADTKEERDEWCAFFNKALTLLRAWGPPQ